MDNRVYYGEYSLKHWIELILTKNIILPEYQRFFVWNEKKVETLIDTFKNKQFVPPITIGAFKLGNQNQNLILDGQQRLTSVLLAYLGMYPDENIYKIAVDKFANENDDEEEVGEQLDNVFEWTFQKLTEKGRNKEIILSKTISGNYKNIEFNVSPDFFENTFLGFSYLVPSIQDEKEQQKYYSSVFRNINIQGVVLLPQESRASLYFLDKDLVQFFEPDFAKMYVVKSVSNETKIDIVRCLSLISQFHKDLGANNVARGFKQNMEKYYEDYIFAVVNDLDNKYGKFTSIFPAKKYEDRYKKLLDNLNSLEIKKEFPSIIDLDMYFIGIINTIIFENKTIDSSNKEKLKQKIEKKISIFKADTTHTKAPSNLGNLRARINSSIEIYKEYAS